MLISHIFPHVKHAAMRFFTITSAYLLHLAHALSADSLGSLLRRLVSPFAIVMVAKSRRFRCFRKQ